MESPGNSPWTVPSTRTSARWRWTPAVVNLTQYESYFPERRPFFTEGSEIFRYGFGGTGMGGSDLGDLFYSRRTRPGAPGESLLPGR